MSDLLKQFLLETRLVADPELIERWEWDMRFHGDQNIKPQAAHARRTATALRKASEKFGFEVVSVQCTRGDLPTQARGRLRSSVRIGEI